MRNMPGDAITSKQFGTILAWPQGATAEQVTSLLLSAGYGQYECNQLVKKETPFFLGRVRDGFEREVLPKLKTGGMAAAVFTQEQLDSIPSPVSAKRLQAAIGAPRPMYAVEPWRGEGTALLMDEVILIVRASVGRTKSTVEVIPGGASATSAILLGPEAAVMHAALSGMNTPQVSKKTSGDAAEVIEMFRLDGTRVRINSEKFNYDILGKAKALTDRQNMDQLMLMLSEQAVNAEIDLDFKRFNPPPNTVKVQSTMNAGGATVTNVDAWPSFELYAAWRYLVQRVQCGLEP